MSDPLTDYLREHEAALVALRRQLHSRPELSGHEVATTEAIELRLRTAGLAPQRLPSGTGLLCDLGPAGAPVVALRADIDALGLQEQSGLDFASQVPGVAHACGHDVHATVVLGAGLALHRSGLLTDRAVRLVFEPAEETVPGGAVEVVACGGLADVAWIFGLHCDPKVDVGRVAVRPGALTSAADMVEIELHGPGGHTARPGLTVDLLAATGRLLTALPDELAARCDGPVRLVFGAVHGGDAPNVIPATAVVRGSLRTPDPQVWDRAAQVLPAAVESVVAGTGAAATIRHVRGVPPLLNDPVATAHLAAAAAAVVGADGVVEAEHSWGGDSFAWYTQQVPGSYGRLGVHDPGSGLPRGDLHAAGFVADERAIPVGVRVLAGAALAVPVR